jgi:glucose/mannose transport system permease protein
MALRWSKVSPQLALAPAVLVTAVAFLGAICWTFFMSFTQSRRFPEYFIDPEKWSKNYDRLFKDKAWDISLGNLLIFGVGSMLAIIFGFIIAAMIERERRGEDVFRTIFLYPLAVSLIVTGLVWRWLFNPGFGVQKFLIDLGFENARFDWLNQADTAMYGIILATLWQSMGFYMALMLSGLKSINTEIWSAAKLDGVSLPRLYLEIIVPMMRFTFFTCAILLSLGVVKAYDIIVAMTNGGPGQSTWMPAFFTIQAYWKKSSIGYASAAAVIMLLITLAIFLPLVALTAWQLRRREAQVR